MAVIYQWFDYVYDMTKKKGTTMRAFTTAAAFRYDGWNLYELKTGSFLSPQNITIGDEIFMTIGGASLERLAHLELIQRRNEGGQQ